MCVREYYIENCEYLNYNEKFFVNVTYDDAYGSGNLKSILRLALFKVMLWPWLCC